MSSITVCPQCSQLNRFEPNSARQAVCGKCESPLAVEGAVSHVSAAALEKLVEKSPLPVVVDFWAPWCAPCRAFAPQFESVALQLASRFAFVKLNTQEHPAAGQRYRIQGIPTLAMFQKGVEKDRVSGALPAAEFRRWVEQAGGAQS